VRDDAATCTLKGGVVVNAATNSVVFNLIARTLSSSTSWRCPSVRYFRPTHHRRTRATRRFPAPGLRVHVVQPELRFDHEAQSVLQGMECRGATQGYPNEIEMTFGSRSSPEVTAVENGQAD